MLQHTREREREKHVRAANRVTAPPSRFPPLDFPPVDKLLDHFHPSVELVESQDVLLSEETQPRAFPKVLHTDRQPVQSDWELWSRLPS